jgi:hypothetical protein
MKLIRISLALFLGISSLLSCSMVDEDLEPYPCIDGKCDADFIIDPNVSPGVYQDSNDYWHIKFWGPKYFTIAGRLDELDPKYVLNKVPLVATHYDSDYWIVFNSISFKIPIYSVLSWFTDKSYKNPISVGNLVVNLTDLAKLQAPLNIAGYQINKNFCWDCPYAVTLLGTFSKYNYNPRQQFFLDKEMVGDTLKVMVNTTFNTDVGRSESIEKEFNIIIE